MSKYVIYAVASIALLLSAISGTSVAVAFPIITTSFNASLVLAGWVLSISQLASTVVMPLAGKASDILGRKFTLIAALVLFTAGSFFCAIAPNIQTLIAARCIQGMGAGAFLPAATGVVIDEFPHSRQRAIGFFSSIFPIGQIIGPNLGGWMVHAFGWRSIFWLNIPLGVLAMIIAAILLRPGKREHANFDGLGIGLFTSGISAIMIAISTIGNSKSPQDWIGTALLFAAGIALIILFIRHESKARDPIIDPQVLHERPFLAANIFNFALGACIFSIASLIPLYAVSIYSMSTINSGIILTPKSITMMLVSAVASFFLVRWGYRRPMIIGTILIVLSLAFLGIEAPGLNIDGLHINATWLLVLVMTITGMGMGLAIPAANNACIELMPKRAATITGVRGMFRQSGGAISISIATLVLQGTNDMARGFTIVFWGMSIILAITIPIIFLMPKAPE